jgi:hypothetical protein
MVKGLQGTIDYLCPKIIKLFIGETQVPSLSDKRLNRPHSRRSAYIHWLGLLKSKTLAGLR